MNLHFVVKLVLFVLHVSTNSPNNIKRKEFITKMFKEAIMAREYLISVLEEIGRIESKNMDILINQYPRQAYFDVFTKFFPLNNTLERCNRSTRINSNTDNNAQFAKLNLQESKKLDKLSLFFYNIEKNRIENNLKMIEMVKKEEQAYRENFEKINNCDTRNIKKNK
ncbi:hypothetical protein BDAP_000625 [Binucleata daphniae]